MATKVGARRPSAKKKGEAEDELTPLAAGRLLLEAVLHKRSDTLGLWHQRFVRITSREGRLLLTYWLSKDLAGKCPRNPRGQYDLSNCRVDNKVSKASAGV
jgi:hypothetical protein